MSDDQPRCLGVYVLPGGRRVTLDNDAKVSDLLDVIEQLRGGYFFKCEEVREWIAKAHEWAR